MTTTAQSEVNDVVAAVEAAPGVDQGTRAAVRDLADDVLAQVNRCDGQDLRAFAAATLQIGIAGCGAAGTDIANGGAAPSALGEADAWLDTVGFSERERILNRVEQQHFARVAAAGEQIRDCCQAVEEIRTTTDTAVGLLVAPPKSILNLAVDLNIHALVPFAVELIMDSLASAKDAVSDGNRSIETCLEAIAACLGEVADETEAFEAVKEAEQTEGLALGANPPGELAAQPATTPAALTFDFTVDTAENVPVQAVGREAAALFQPAAAHTQLGVADAMVGSLAGTGAAATLGGIEFLSDSLQEAAEQSAINTADTHQPHPEPVPPTAPAVTVGWDSQPVPEQPTPEQPAVRSAADGVIAPPPELAQVAEPAPPPKKFEAIDASDVQHNAAPAPEPQVPPAQPQNQAAWRMKKMGEW